MTTNETGQPDAVAAVLEFVAGNHCQDGDVCGWCEEDWPCDAIVLAREVERLDTEVKRLRGLCDWIASASVAETRRMDIYHKACEAWNPTPARTEAE